LGDVRGARADHPRPPGPQEEGDLAPGNGPPERLPAGEREDLPPVRLPVAPEEVAHALEGLPERGDRAARREPEVVEPRSAREPEVRAPLRGLVEERDVTRKRDRVARERGHGGRAERHPPRLAVQLA